MSSIACPILCLLSSFVEVISETCTFGKHNSTVNYYDTLEGQKCGYDK